MLMNAMEEFEKHFKETYCNRCDRLIGEEKYFLLNKYYCRECMNALECDTWFKEFCKDTRFRQIEV